MPRCGLEHHGQRIVAIANRAALPDDRRPRLVMAATIDARDLEAIKETSPLRRGQPHPRFEQHRHAVNGDLIDRRARLDQAEAQGNAATRRDHVVSDLGDGRQQDGEPLDRAVELEFHNRVHGVALGGRHADLDTVFGLLQSGQPARKDTMADDARRDRRKRAQADLDAARAVHMADAVRLNRWQHDHVAWPAENVQVDRVAASCAPAPIVAAGNRELTVVAGLHALHLVGRAERSAACPIDAFSILFEPGAKFAEAHRLLRLDPPVGHRAEVEEEVAVSARADDEHSQALFKRSDRVVRFPAPLVLQRGVRLPCALGLEMADDVLRGVEIPGSAEAVIDEDVALERPQEADDTLAASPVKTLWHVEPKPGERAVFRDQLLALRLEVLGVAVEVRGAPANPARGVPHAAPGACDREIGVSPIAGRIVREEPDLLLAARLGKLVGHVAPERAFHDVVIRFLGVPKTEPVMVFDNQNDIFGARPLREPGPLAGIEPRRIPAAEERVIFRGRRRIGSGPADLLARKRDRPPGDEHAKTHVLPFLYRATTGCFV